MQAAFAQLCLREWEGLVSAAHIQVNVICSLEHRAVAQKCSRQVTHLEWKWLLEHRAVAQKCSRQMTHLEWKWLQTCDWSLVQILDVNAAACVLSERMAVRAARVIVSAALHSGKGDWLTELYCAGIKVLIWMPVGQPILDTMTTQSKGTTNNSFF